MPRTKISEYSTTNSDNTDIESININEGCAPSGINNAIRELMVHLKEFQTGSSGDPLTVAGTFVASGGATIAASAGTSASPSIHFSGDTNTGIFSPAADTIAFAEGGVEAMRINSDGEVLVGGTTSIFGVGLSIQGTNAASGISIYRNDTTISSGNVIGTIAFYGNDTTSNTPTNLASIQAVASGTHAAGDNPTDLVFATTPDGSETVAEAGRITQSGAYVLKGGTTTAAAGVGIIFPATQVASADVNCLDDYEEGTWTPTYVPTTGAFTSVTYDAQTSGRYTKIGNVVYLQGTLRTDAITVGTASGGVKVGGLPFTTINSVPNASVSVGYSAAFSGDEPNGGITLLNTSTIGLYYKATSNGDSVELDVTDLGTGANANYIIFEVFYTI